MVIFTLSEIAALRDSPEALRALADWNSAQATMADAIGPEYAHSVIYHEARAAELRSIADKIESQY